MALQEGRTSQNLLNERIVEEIMSIAEAQHKPSRNTVAMFTANWNTELKGVKLSDAAVAQLTRNILQVLHSAGTAATEFHRSVKRAEDGLLSLGLSTTKAKRIAESLMAIGNDVRGPDDIRLMKLR
jgi:hypothetical protein